MVNSITHRMQDAVRKEFVLVSPEARMTVRFVLYIMYEVCMYVCMHICK